MKKMVTVLLAISLTLLSAQVYAQGFSYEGDNNYVSFGAIWQDQYGDHLVLPKSIRSTGERVFIFSPKARQWAAYDSGGQVMGYGRANGGNNFCAELNEPCYTPHGSFRVYRKGSQDCRSSIFPLETGGGAAMPYCMFFKGGSAIHGSPFYLFITRVMDVFELLMVRLHGFRIVLCK